MSYVLKQQVSKASAGWWNWDVSVEGDLENIESVEYTLHPTYPDPKRTTTDRSTGFQVSGSGWGEFMVYADVTERGGARIPLRHWLRFQAEDSGSGPRLLLTCAKEDDVFTDDLHSALENGAFVVSREPDGPAVDRAAAAIFVISAVRSAWIDEELRLVRERRKAVLVLLLEDVEAPACFASLRVRDLKNVAAAASWVRDIMDRSALPLADSGVATGAGSFWSKRLALASEDLARAAQAVYPVVTREGALIGSAVAVGPGRLLGIAVEHSYDLFIRTASGPVLVQRNKGIGGLAEYNTSITFPTYLRAGGTGDDPAVAAIGVTDTGRTVSPGWLTGPVGAEVPHDARTSTQGAAVISLSSGLLLGIQLQPGTTIGVSSLQGLVEFAAATDGAGLESAFDESLERAVAEDYSDRQGYDAKFLGPEVPLPVSKKAVKVLPYTNFSVAVHADRKMCLFTAVNLDGKNEVAQTRGANPWRLDPRVDAAAQLGDKFYEGTPFDRGHMVRRLDPVWGPKSTQAERDTFHFTNSCPQHKNLNRKTWSDLEDYVYLNAGKNDLRVSVFTGPVLGSDDPEFHGAKLPEEFWKVVVMKRDDTGKLSATAYLLSQQDMITGLEFAFGEFRTYQVTIAQIEKKTGLDFGKLREFDPKAPVAGLEAVAAPKEIQGPDDLHLDLSKPAPVQAPPPISTAEVITAPTEPPAWQDLRAGERRLEAALDTFDWAVVADLTKQLIEKLAREQTPPDERSALKVLKGLRRKRRFGEMTRLVDAFVEAGATTQQIKRLYAQALIDQGVFYGAELVLKSILGDNQAPQTEKDEAQGLLGRTYKQIYVNAAAPENPRMQSYLQLATSSYWVSYSLNPELTWHGINAVALAVRAERDGVPLKLQLGGQQVAKDILRKLDDREITSRTSTLDAFDLATALEAHLALGEYDQALVRAKAYADATDADAFEIASTLRQMKEVWKLDVKSAPGATLLPVLEAALLARQGGAVSISPRDMQSTTTNLFQLERVFGSDKSQTLEWYRNGLARANSVARIEVDGKGFGTAWVIKSKDFGFGGADRKLLITNAHVIGPDTPDRYPGSLRPEQATVHFQIQDKKMPVGKVLFHSPVQQLDATIIEVADIPADAPALDVDCTVPAITGDVPPRLYVIGHPGGRDLEFSLQDNYLLAANERLVHYRTPTEGGSSGSPVFGPTGWKVVALHHAGRKDMPRIDGKSGTYEANEGIAINAVCSSPKKA